MKEIWNLKKQIDNEIESLEDQIKKLADKLNILRSTVEKISDSVDMHLVSMHSNDSFWIIDECIKEILWKLDRIKTILETLNCLLKNFEEHL